jgi:glutamate-1-semialdehyde 2,1-aminomutase
MKNINCSAEQFKLARQYLPGGVNSPVRAFKGVGGTPLFIERGQGSRIYDLDGHEYIDYVGAWGPLILGHCHPRVIEAITQAAQKGTCFGAPNTLEVDLAKMICEAFPSIQMVRMVNSGTEATMSAIRLARAYTGRDKILKFAGCYHGHNDGLLVKAGSGVATLSIPDSAGIPASTAALTLTAPYNNLPLVEQWFSKYAGEIAAVIVEPVAANMGIVLPEKDFLQSLRRLTSETGALLILDEVITGFRLAFGGAQSIYNLKPDLTCLGKIIGGGMPVGAYGGRRDIMQMVAPEGPVYQAGTLSGNPVVMAAGLATLKVLKEDDPYRELEKKTAVLREGINRAIPKNGVKSRVQGIGSLFTLFFTENQVTDYASALTANTQLYAKLFHALLEEGVYFPPSQFETAFVSVSHTEEDIQKTIQAISQALKQTR